MYNRYIRNDQGVYTRIPEEEPRRSQTPPPPPGGPGPSPAGGDGPPPGNGAFHAQPGGGRPPHTEPPPQDDSRGDSLTGLLRRLLDQFHLNSLDTGDLLLLAILYFLFREGADEELLVALGLLLIL